MISPIRVWPDSAAVRCCVCVFQVESLLEQLDQKFDDMSTQILDRSTSPVSSVPSSAHICRMYAVTQMSSRVDALEASIHDIISSDTPAVPLPPLPPSLPQSPSIPQRKSTGSG